MKKRDSSRSAFFSRRVQVAVLLCMAACSVSGWMNLIYKPAGGGLSYVLQGSTGSRPVPSVATTTSSSNLVAPSSLPLNTWSHVAATYDGAMMRLYINGLLVGSQPQSGPITVSVDPLNIGGNVSGENWSGRIDEVPRCTTL